MKLSEYQKSRSDFKVKCLTLGLYTQVSDSGPQGPLVNLNCVKDTQRLYQNGLILHLVRENQDFNIKINMYIL